MCLIFCTANNSIRLLDKIPPLHQYDTARAQPRAEMEGRVKERVDQITKSPLDTREYMFIRLQNDMKVLLISDKDTDKAAAALSVNVG